MDETFQSLRRRLEALSPAAARPGGDGFGLGLPAIDALLGGGLARAALHEIMPAGLADASAAAGFAAMLAMRAAPAGRTVVWVRQAHAESETGALHAPGLSALGLDPAALVMVRVRDVVGVLRAGVEAVRCTALGAVVMEPWGSHRALDFTATRRLVLAAERSGVPVLLLRHVAETRHSAAGTRWLVATAPSRALLANAPGRPAFDITLSRHRAGPAGLGWRLEWDHEHHQFRQAAPLSGAVVSISSRRPAAAQVLPLARAG